MRGIRFAKQKTTKIVNSSNRVALTLPKTVHLFILWNYAGVAQLDRASVF